MSKLLIFGANGGIGSAIKEALKEHEITVRRRDEVVLIEEFDWIIFAQGFLGEQDMYQTFQANILSSIVFTEFLLPHLKQGVIYISSTAALTPNSRFPIYSASKSALNAYSVAMAKAHPELRFISICPGPTDTPMWRGLGLTGMPQEPRFVADAVKMAIEGKFISGAIVVVRDGQITCQ